MRDRSAASVARIATDADALETFYRQHFESVRRFVARRVSDPHMAADLVADVFLAAIDSAHTFVPAKGSPKHWLYGVARNVLAAERRRGARASRAASRISGRQLLDEDDIADLVERIDAEAQGRRLYREMEQLPEVDRGLLELVALEGLTVADAAAVLGISRVAARVRLHRARHRLQQRLAAWNAAPDIVMEEA